jgi:uncharacterized protein YcfJ
MSSLHLLTISTTKSKTQLESLIPKNDADGALQGIINFLTGVAGGVDRALMYWKAGAVQAHGHLTVASTGSGAGEACTVCNVTLTGRTSTTTMNEFNVSSTPATQAAAMAACINASTDLAGKVTATSALGVVTITAVVPGLAGNGFELSAGNLANTTAGAFASGSDGDKLTIDQS